MAKALSYTSEREKLQHGPWGDDRMTLTSLGDHVNMYICMHLQMYIYIYIYANR